MKVKVAGVDYEVLLVDLEEDFGSTNHPQRKIRINKSCKPRERDATLLHEIIHAALKVTGWEEVLGDGKDEGLVTALENALFPLYGKPMSRVVEK